MPLNRTFSGNMAGSSWGLFQSNGELKPQFSQVFNGIHPVESRKTREIFAGGNLSSGYSIGVNSSKNLTDWLTKTEDGSMRMSYPTGQSWGAVFITVGEPVNPPRPSKDFSGFHSVSLALRGEVGNELVQVGVKDAGDPDDGSETIIDVQNLTTSWQTYSFTITSFTTADPSDLYVPLEFVFSGSKSQTVYFKDIEYLP